MFDTLVRFDRNRLPAVQIGGAGGTVLGAAAPPVSPLPLCRGWGSRRSTTRSSGATRRPTGIRADSHEEVPAARRLELFYRRVGVDPAAIPSAVTERLLAAHMACLAGAAEPMPGQGSSSTG